MLLESIQSDPSMLGTFVSLVETHTQFAIDDEERCDFDLCSYCAEKDIEKVCHSGHHLHPIKLRGDSIYSWMCDVCGFQCSPEKTVEEEVALWRCEIDKRYSGGEDREGRSETESEEATAEEAQH